MLVTHFTDPACPFAFSAEPMRLQLEWHYGDQLEWRTVLVGLHSKVEEMEAKGFDTAKLAGFARIIQAKHGMPIDVSERERLAVSMPACRAAVAVRLHRPELAELMLRALRVRTFAGELLDEPATIEGAAMDAGIDPTDLASWSAEPATEAALQDDMRAARTPLPAALVLDHKLADAGGSDGGRRYTCPSFEFTGTQGVTFAAPGMQPWETYDVLVANAAPDIRRRAVASDVFEVLEWAPYPLATVEVAALLGTSIEDAREQLTGAASFEPVGEDGYWSLQPVTA
ncbi:MAG: hypothetical protein JWM25_1641 [Thermoleophilia bacterium]|nr:hypothetical protein [Thermoleophilia bacterium]MCZ4497056.1 hypothetical protein [Thermoleophilia bacterium]